MKYLFLAYGDEKRLRELPISERDILMEACATNDEALRESGRLLAVQGLQDSSTAITICVQNGNVAISDGPFAETKEQLIGLFLIDARDLNEAIQVAATMPQVRGGPIEVRPLQDTSHYWPATPVEY